ncbi:lymphocyte antigen 6D [Cottoperca gobio]|uniref:Lymphocyte antigen 6D n=1 Tax=Cottoperca gobio TaxID=56716 RepID=A0A6J2QXU1_COTGO|nr:lymphocyte antigen 6D-like [Cottoperca gobio]
MKVQLLTLLLLLCCTQVLTLRCYTCVGEDDEDCKVETECPATAQYCMTMQYGGELSRTCQDYCAEDDNTYCCQEDLCDP